MTKRIFGSIFWVALVTLLMGFIFTVFTVHHKTTVATQEKALAVCNTLAPMVEEHGADVLDQQSTDQYQIRLVDKNNKVLYSPDVLPIAPEFFVCRKELTNGSVLMVAIHLPSSTDVLRDLLPSFSITLVIFLFISLLVANRLAKRTVKPIEEIDLKNPKPIFVYPELKPLVQKLSAQNQTIRSQMSDLFQQQQKFDTITENMSEGMLIVDHAGSILSFNASAAGILSLTLEHKGQSVYGNSFPKELESIIKDALEGKHPQQHLAIAERTYQAIGNPVRVKEETVGAVLALLDVTEREERDRLRQEFSANVSHELKTPLTSISGFAEIMKNGMVKPEDTAHFASRIYDEAQRLILLIGDIIQLSRLEDNNLSEKVQRIDLYDIASDVFARLQHQAQQKEIEFRLQGGACTVKGVPHILDEMIYNLCDNALKYNKAKGSVTLTVLPRENDIMVAVADTGIGIPYEEQDRVFERFYRIDKSHSKEIGGTGLGLSIVKHGAVFHNATVELESVPGEGTCFTLLFPKEQ